MEARTNKPMTWILFKSSVSKLWIWFKEHWQLPFLFIWTAFVYVFARRNTDAVVDVLNAKKKSYEKQIKELKNRHKNEIIERDNLIKQYHKTVDAIEKKYKEQERILSLREKKRIKEIVKKSKGEPSVIKTEIEKSFGFVYID